MDVTGLIRLGKPSIEVPHRFCGLGHVRKSQLRFEYEEVLAAVKRDNEEVPRPGEVPRPEEVPRSEEVIGRGEAPQSQRIDLRIDSSSSARAGSGDGENSYHVHS